MGVLWGSYRGPIEVLWGVLFGQGPSRAAETWSSRPRSRKLFNEAEPFCAESGLTSNSRLGQSQCTGTAAESASLQPERSTTEQDCRAKARSAGIGDIRGPGSLCRPTHRFRTGPGLARRWPGGSGCQSSCPGRPRSCPGPGRGDGARSAGSGAGRPRRCRPACTRG